MSNNLRHYRILKKLSQEQLARLTQTISPNYISKFERGDRIPWPGAKQQLSSALGVPVEELFASSPPKQDFLLYLLKMIEEQIKLIKRLQSLVTQSIDAEQCASWAAALKAATEAYHQMLESRLLEERLGITQAQVFE